jgi:hypothetical protein
MTHSSSSEIFLLLISFEFIDSRKDSSICFLTFLRDLAAIISKIIVNNRNTPYIIASIQFILHGADHSG